PAADPSSIRVSGTWRSERPPGARRRRRAASMRCCSIPRAPTCGGSLPRCRPTVRTPLASWRVSWGPAACSTGSRGHRCRASYDLGSNISSDLAEKEPAGVVAGALVGGLGLPLAVAAGALIREAVWAVDKACADDDHDDQEDDAVFHGPRCNARVSHFKIAGR